MSERDLFHREDCDACDPCSCWEWDRRDHEHTRNALAYERRRAEQAEAECVRRADLFMRACGAIDDAYGWLSGLEESFASPNRECSQEDVNADGTREGNTCIDSEPDDLEFPDDWCERCYILKCVREARAARAALVSSETT